MHTSDGRATTLWRLRARHTVATCVMQPLAVGALLIVHQDDEVVFQEAFPDAHLAEGRARALRARLQAKGWKPVADADHERRRA